MILLVMRKQESQLHTEVELTEHDNGKEMQSINSEADSLVDTKELLEFIDTMDVLVKLMSLNPKRNQIIL